VCGKLYTIQEYIEEIDEGTWEKLSYISCDRA